MLAAARNAVDSLGSELVFACTKLEQTKLLREVVSVSNMGKRALKSEDSVTDRENENVLDK